MALIRKLLLFFTGPLLSLELKRRSILSRKSLAILEIRNSNPVKFWPYTAHFIKIDFIKILKRLLSPRVILPKVKDPVNLIFITDSPEKVRNIFYDNGWKDTGESSQYLFIDGRWRESLYNFELTRLSQREERVHIRLYGVQKKNGIWVLIASAHQEYHDKKKQDHIIISWEAAERLTASAFSRFPQSLTDKITQENWRGCPNDGRATIIDLSRPKK